MGLAGHARPRSLHMAELGPVAEKSDKNAEHCSFCEELFGPDEISSPLVKTFFAEAALSSRTLFETEKLFVVPSLGPLTVGHILVLPKSHYYSVGEIPPADLPELEYVVRESHKILTLTFGSCLAFEHGCVEDVGKPGACIDHAHLHMLPLKGDLRPAIEKRFGCGERIQSLRELRQFAGRRVPYLYYQDQDGEGHAYEALEAPSQFFRQVVAVLMHGAENWD